jgi:hypothetical protein
MGSADRRNARRGRQAYVLIRKYAARATGPKLDEDQAVSWRAGGGSLRGSPASGLMSAVSDSPGFQPLLRHNRIINQSGKQEIPACRVWIKAVG